MFVSVMGYAYLCSVPTKEQLKERMELMKRELKQAKRLMNKK
jgi:hypothetical protein